MDDDIDFDELFGPPPGPDDPPAHPTYRATVVGARVTVIHWLPNLDVGPATRVLLREREAAGVSIADLNVLGTGTDRELVVRYLARGGGARAERALTRWAAMTGHKRLWLPDRLVALEPPKRFAPAATTCTNCGLEWREGAPEFWSMVRENGAFPAYCLVCGGDLPQWTIQRKRPVT